MSKLAKNGEASTSSASISVRSGISHFPSFGSSAGWLILLAVALPLLAIISPVNHDETQYIAAAQLASEGLIPFRDYLYLQTPYQIYFFAPLFSIFDQNGFLAARVFTGLIGIGILTATYLTLRQLQLEAKQAAICCILLWLCHTFVFSVTVVRNDALPALLLAAAILIAAKQLSGATEETRRISPWFFAGILLGFATGTKISYLAPALAFAGFPVWAFFLGAVRWPVALVRSASVGLGLFVTLLPLLWFRDIAPLAFDYGNFGYHAEAPIAWYAANGLEDRLTVFAKFRDVFLTLARGPALFALMIYGWWRFRTFRDLDVQPEFVILVDVLVLAGLAATIAPTPTWRQYAMPLLPPLFIGLGLAWQNVRMKQSTVPQTTRLAMILAAIVGIGQPIFQIWQGTLGSEASALTINREGAYLAREAAAAGLEGPSVSLSPEVVLASGLPLDPTFATGPFAYRTASMVAPEDRHVLKIVSTEGITAYLERTQPDTIVTGYENFDHVDSIGLEEPIEAYARSRGYRRVDSPFGDAIFWLRIKEPVSQ